MEILRENQGNAENGISPKASIQMFSTVNNYVNYVRGVLHVSERNTAM